MNEERARVGPAADFLRLCKVAAAASFVLIAAPAGAQYQYGAPPPQNIPDSPRSGEASQGPAAASPGQLLRAASCLAARDSADAARLLGTSPYSTQERQEAVRTLRAAERCIRARGLATSPLMLRGAIAEALYEVQFAQPPAVRSPVVVAAPMFRAEAASRQDLAPAFGLADCIAGRHPELVRALLATEPESEAEAGALQALNPVFGQCVAAGTSLNIDRSSLRSLAAEALYRWSVVQRDGAASPWAASGQAGTPS